MQPDNKDNVSCKQSDSYQVCFVQKIAEFSPLQMIPEIFHSDIRCTVTTTSTSVHIKSLTDINKVVALLNSV